jgi:hypothetical protein
LFLYCCIRTHSHGHMFIEPFHGDGHLFWLHCSAFISTPTYLTLFFFAISLLFFNFSEVNAETKYRAWLQECYEDTFMRLLSIMSKHKPSMQLQALSTMMKLVSLEGKYPIDYRGREEYYFPVQKLRVSIFSLYSPDILSYTNFFYLFIYLLRIYNLLHSLQ